MAGRNKGNMAKASDSVFFWETARRFLDHELPKIRKKSRNTIATYRASLNICIGFLEDVKRVPRGRICFDDLDKGNLKDYLVWMGDVKGWNPKTCNLRMTAVRSLLSYASEECMDITPIFVSSGTIRSLNVPCGEIKYFEDGQIRALLDSSGKEKRPSGACRHLPHCLSCYL